MRCSQLAAVRTAAVAAVAGVVAVVAAVAAAAAAAAEVAAAAGDMIRNIASQHWAYCTSGRPMCMPSEGFW